MPHIMGAVKFDAIITVVGCDNALFDEF